VAEALLEGSYLTEPLTARRFCEPFTSVRFDGIEAWQLVRPEVVRTRCRYRGIKIPNPWLQLNHA
jgi:hypothetical protein